MTETTDAPVADEPVVAQVQDLPDLPDPGGIIFDLDGTLVDTVEARIQAWLDTFDEVGFAADRKHVAGLIGADGRRLAREVAEIAGRRLSDDRAEAIDRRAGERYDKINTDPRPLPGALELVRALETSALPGALATSSRAEQVGTSLGAIGLEAASHIVDGSQVAQAKPAPDLLLHAAERIDVPSHRCWCVGDSTWDMRAARAATMVPVGVATGAVSLDVLRAAGARVAIDSLEALVAELRRRGLVPGTTG